MEILPNFCQRYVTPPTACNIFWRKGSGYTPVFVVRIQWNQILHKIVYSEKQTKQNIKWKGRSALYFLHIGEGTGFAHKYFKSFSFLWRYLSLVMPNSGSKYDEKWSIVASCLLNFQNLDFKCQ